MKSLRLRLLAWLLPPLMVVAVVAAGGAYMFLERRLTAAYDHNLGDIARALVPYIRTDERGISLDFTPQAEAALARFQGAGMRLAKSTDAIESWL